MKKQLNKTNGVIAILVMCVMLSAALLPSTMGANVDSVAGFDKGPSYKSVVPLKKTTFVNFDEESYVDDYAYLAAVPTAVFDDGEKLYSNPLLFYQDEYPIEEDKEKSLNARQGIDYFMEDWMGYCNGKMDQLTLINVGKGKMDSSWKAKEITEIESTSPYEIASKLALSEWSYSNDAVIAVIDEEFERPDNKVSGTISDKLVVNKEVKTEYFEVAQTNKLNPQYREFTVPDGYKFIKAKTTFACLEYMVMPFSWIVVPAGDKDMQLYCKYGGDWMQVAACSTNTNQWGMDSEAERAKSYVYQSGDWKVGITDVPTEGGNFQRHGTWAEIFSNMGKGVTYKVDIEMYPGTEIKIPDYPPFECTDVDLKLTWNNPNANLGFLLIGPGGEEVLSVSNESRTDNQEMHLDELGQCLPGESYSVCIFTMDDFSGSLDFEVEYSWSQRIAKEEGDSLTSATEGAVLASVLNAPLLYVSTSEVTESVKETLYKLGVENIYLVNLGEHASDNVIEELGHIATINEQYNKAEQIYKDIMETTHQNDVIFSTIDPWSYIYVNERNPPSGEKEKALYIGPAAYIAAHHGSPVLIVDNHPEFSSAVVWHNEFWKRYSRMRTDFVPSVAEMYITGTRTYDFLKEHDFDKEGMESMITVAGQFDIGMSWDRVFAGKAKPGRILGTPVDTTCIISRGVFYPALIFENPAMDPNGVKLINGSVSHRRPLLAWGKFGLVIDRPSQDETYTYPILHSYTSYMHRFNERVEKYYGFKYQTANEIIPGETNSFNPIDDGVNVKYTGEEGSFHPDVTPTEIAPFYASRAGYDNAFSTSFDAVMHDLNQGVILWIKSGHGTNSGGGGASFWDTTGYSTPLKLFAGATKEENPWRGYEWYLGSTDNPDTMTMEVHGIIPALFGNPNMKGFLGTGVDWGPAKKPILDKVADVLNRPFILPVISYLAPDWLKDKEDYYDGYINSVMLGMPSIPKYHGPDLDDSLGNIYSCGTVTGDCQPAGTYYHLTLIRHGSSFQIFDPWPTSWYAQTWIQSIPRDLAIGQTIGEAYTNGISKVGILYISEPPQWWWDSGENVCFYGDPDLRPFVPSTEYSDNNHWEKEDTEALRYDEQTDISGHNPFGATGHPNEKQPGLDVPIWIIVAIIVALLAIIVVAVTRKKTNKK